MNSVTLYTHLRPIIPLGRFHPVLRFRPSQGPFILGLVSSIRLLTARYWPFLLVGQIQPVVTVGPFVAH